MAGDFDIAPGDWEEDMSGKGDAPRPMQVDAETFADRWARTFGALSRCTCEQPKLSRVCPECSRVLETLGDPEE